MSRAKAKQSGGLIKKSGKKVNGSFSFDDFSSGIHKTATTNVQTTSSFFYSPELTTESWLLPKTRQEILKWARIFFNLEPYVQQIIIMHSLYPFSKFEVNTDDESITEFYKDMSFNEHFDLFEFILKASLELSEVLREAISLWKHAERRRRIVPLGEVRSS